MTVFTKTAVDIFAAQDASGAARKVSNHDVQVWGTEVERALTAFQAGGGVIFQSKAQADANLGYDANTMAWIFDDDPSLAGIYQKQGASGSGSWQRVGDLPYSFILATNTNSGDPNAIEATTATPIPTADGGALIALPIVADNTGSPVTVSFNGGPALTVKTIAGNDVPIAALADGMTVWGFKEGDEFRLVTDLSSAGILAGAEAAAEAAEDAADRAQSYSAMLSADKIKFATVAALLADETMSYTSGEGHIEVGPGDIIEAEGYRYKVAAIPVADYHVATAGGILLYALPGQDGRVSLLQFGQPSGVDDTDMMQKAFDNFRHVIIPNIGQPWMVNAISRGSMSTGHHSPGRPHAFALLDNQIVEFEAGATISVIPNDLPRYTVFMAHLKSNITISGKGFIIGDRHDHQGSEGEWGHGIAIYSCRNTTIRDVEVSDCWGDGLYFGESDDDETGPSEVNNTIITLLGVTSRNNRRQGMSVITGDRLFAGWCNFLDTNGTSPSAGVDLEPNRANQGITDALFFGCHFIGNAGPGMVCDGRSGINRDVFVINCRFANNQYHLDSTMPNTIVDGCIGSGTTTTNVGYLGGFTITDGEIRNCHVSEQKRSAYGFRGDGNVELINCSAEYTGVSTDDELYFLWIEKTGGRVSVRDCPNANAYRSVIRASGSAASLEIIGVTARRYDDDTYGTNYPLWLFEIDVDEEIIIRDVRFVPVSGSNITSTVILFGDNDALITGCDVKGWNRSETNWYFGSGTLALGYGNRLPDGTWG